MVLDGYPQVDWVILGWRDDDRTVAHPITRSFDRCLFFSSFLEHDYSTRKGVHEMLPCATCSDIEPVTQSQWLQGGINSVWWHTALQTETAESSVHEPSARLHRHGSLKLEQFSAEDGINTVRSDFNLKLPPPTSSALNLSY